MADAGREHLSAARALYAAGDFAGTVRRVAAAQQAGCECPALLVLKAQALQLADEAGPMSEISECFEAALRLDRGNVDALLEYGWFLFNVLDQPDMAERRFRAALESLRDRNTEAVLGIAKCRGAASEGDQTEVIARLLSELVDAERLRAALAE